MLEGNGTVDMGAYEYDPSQDPYIPGPWWTGLGLSHTNISWGDLDGDGWSNYEEYLCDTHPDDPDSYLPLIECAPYAVDMVSVLVPTTSSERVYDVLWKTNLVELGDWQALGLYVYGTDGLLSIPVTQTADACFYRITVDVP